MNGIITYRAFGWVGYAIVKNNSLLDDSQRPAYLLAMIQRWLAFILNCVVAVLAVIVVTMAVRLSSSTGFGMCFSALQRGPDSASPPLESMGPLNLLYLTYFSAGASLVTLMTFGDYLTQFIQSYTLLETSLGAVNRLKTFSEKITPESQPGEDIIPEVTWPYKGEIEIKDVSASYT